MSKGSSREILIPIRIRHCKLKCPRTRAKIKTNSGRAKAKGNIGREVVQAIPPQTKIILVVAMIKGRVHQTRKVMEVLEIKMARRDLTKEKYSAITVKNGVVMLMNVDM